MNKYELIFTGSEVASHLCTILQFWAEVSFGLVVLAHVAADRFNAFLEHKVST
jgi:hypothetical protein